MERDPQAQGRPVRDRRAHALRPLGELTEDGELLVLVDGENVRRSRWPNLSPDELVERTCDWAANEGVHALVVFDGGRPGDRFVDERCAVVHTGDEIADDWITRRAAELREQGRRYWLVTSDRELRARAGGAAEQTIGGGGFLGQIRES